MNNNLWIGILIGLIAGWGIEWLIDLVYWRRKYRGVVHASHSTRDNLQKIKGIDAAIEQKLNDAGIFTFAALSQLSQSEIEAIIGERKIEMHTQSDSTDEPEGGKLA